MRLIILLVLCLLFVGCSSIPNGPHFFGIESKPKSNESLLYIYRPSARYGIAITIPVLLNGKKIADIGNDGYFPIVVTPGNYVIRPDSDSIDHEFNFEANPGEVFFLRLKLNRKPAICFCSSLEFELADETSALSELQKTRLETDRFYGL